MGRRAREVGLGVLAAVATVGSAGWGGRVPEIGDDAGDGLRDAAACGGARSKPRIFASVGLASLAIDETYVYLNEPADEESARLYSCPLAGCGSAPTLLAQSIDSIDRGPSSKLAAGASMAFFFPLDAEGVGAAPGDGLARYTDYRSDAFGGERHGFYDAVRSDGERVYFATESSLASCPVGATCASATPLYVDEKNRLRDFAISIAEAFLFLQDGSLIAVPLSGSSTRRTVCKGPRLANPRSPLVAFDHVFFGGDDGIYRCPLAGGSVSLYVATDGLGGLAADGADLFWTEPGEKGAVRTCALGASCASPTTIATGSHPGDIVVHGSAVYWADSDAVWVAEK